MSFRAEKATPAGIVSLREAADYFGVKDVRSVRRELARRGLPILKFGRQVRVRADDLRALERVGLTYEVGSRPPDTSVLVRRRARTDGRRMPRNASRQRRRETLEPHLYREHRISCDAGGSEDACDCPTQWRERVEPGLYREHLASCKQWKTARVRGTPSTCKCHFSCDLKGGPNPLKLTKRIYASTHAGAKAEYRARQVAYAEIKDSVRLNGLPPESVCSVFDRYVATLKSPKSRTTYRNSFRKHHQAALGALNVDDLKYGTAILQAHVKTMLPACRASQAARGIYNPQYFERNWRPVKGLLEYAAEERDWPPEAMPDPRLPRVPTVHPTTGEPLERSRTQFDALVVEDVRRVCDWLRTSSAVASGWGRPITSQDADAVALAFLYSLRHGEVRGLQLRCADLVNGRFHLFEQLDEYRNRRDCKYAENEKYSWNLSEPAAVILGRALDNHPLADESKALLFYYGDEPCKPYPKGYLLDVFKQAQRALGITRLDGRKPATFHGLRHSGITYVAELGASLPELMEYARHKDARTTARYLHGLNRVRRGAHRIKKF